MYRLRAIFVKRHRRARKREKSIMQTNIGQRKRQIIGDGNIISPSHQTLPIFNFSAQSVWKTVDQNYEFTSQPCCIGIWHKIMYVRSYMYIFYCLYYSDACGGLRRRRRCLDRDCPFALFIFIYHSVYVVVCVRAAALRGREVSGSWRCQLIFQRVDCASWFPNVVGSVIISEKPSGRKYVWSRALHTLSQSSNAFSTLHIHRPIVLHCTAQREEPPHHNVNA